MEDRVEYLESKVFELIEAVNGLITERNEMADRFRAARANLEDKE